ncbi:hypothetical protein D0W72_26830 [Escherichia coli]|nr:hypothetical protein [Escherichia coli]EFO0407737.1 hypothetical protein [Escherichia coli]
MILFLSFESPLTESLLTSACPLLLGKKLAVLLSSSETAWTVTSEKRHLYRILNSPPPAAA